MDEGGRGMQVSRAKANCWKGLFHYAPRHQGTTQRAGFKLTMVGRLVTVPGQQASRPPVSVPVSLGPIAPDPLPGFHPIRLGALSAPHPAPQVNPLLPVAYWQPLAVHPC